MSIDAVGIKITLNGIVIGLILLICLGVVSFIYHSNPAYGSDFIPLPLILIFLIISICLSAISIYYTNKIYKDDAYNKNVSKDSALSYKVFSTAGTLFYLCGAAWAITELTQYISQRSTISQSGGRRRRR